jgi:hypothetical protein
VTPKCRPKRQSGGIQLPAPVSDTEPQRYVRNVRHIAAFRARPDSVCVRDRLSAWGGWIRTSAFAKTPSLGGGTRPSAYRNHLNGGLDRQLVASGRSVAVLHHSRCDRSNQAAPTGQSVSHAYGTMRGSTDRRRRTQFDGSARLLIADVDGHQTIAWSRCACEAQLRFLLDRPRYLPPHCAPSDLMRQNASTRR